MPDDQPKPVSDITAWHAHVYYDPTTRDRAACLRDWVAERFGVQMGRWHDVPVGPHARAMYQVAFDVNVFPTLVPFLALNRMGLSILVHPNTDDAYTDHLEHALWLGEKLPLDGSVLPRSLRAAGQPPEQVAPNTKLSS
jgi:aromatic ring-cleaving dioxygenase